MNRETLFRGKRVDNGEWVEGYYLETENPVYRAFIISSIDIDVHSCGMTILDSEIFEVIPKTVGQYTGLTDKNGKKIFEGDIVKYGENCNYKVVFEQRGGNAYFGIVISHIETWGFSPSVPAKCMEIIGNIHDNPELLEVSR